MGTRGANTQRQSNSYRINAWVWYRRWESHRSGGAKKVGVCGRLWLSLDVPDFLLYAELRMEHRKRPALSALCDAQCKGVV